MLGIRQSGLPDFRIANIIKDARLLNEAKEEAFSLIEKDPDLNRPEHEALRAVLLHRWAGRMDLAKIG
jgi:ATP-dependent DNA helicase RecG